MSSTTTTTITFQSIFRVKYIRHVIFNQISNTTNQLGDSIQRKSVKGRDIIKLPYLEMISKYAMPLNFVRHYLPKDCSHILLDRRRLAITQYCHHPNAYTETSIGMVEYITIPNQEILEYLVKRCPTSTPLEIEFLKNAMDMAIKISSLSIVKLLHSSKGVRLNGRHMSLACKASSFEIVKYIHDSGIGKCEDGMDEAAKNSFEIVKFLHFKRTDGCSKGAMNNAAENGQLDIVKFLHENRGEGATAWAMDIASMNGHIDVVKFLHFHRREGATTKAMDNASLNGHIEIVQFLEEHRAEGGTSKAIYNAAKNDHINVVKYIYKNRPRGTATDEFVIGREVIPKVSIELLSYLVDTFKAKCTLDAVVESLQCGRLDIFHYLYNQFSADPDIWTPRIMDVQLQMGSLIFEGASTMAMDWAAQYNHFEVLKFLHVHRTEGATTYAMDGAAKNGNIEIVKYLQEHRSEGATTDAMDYSAQYGLIEIVKYLHDNRTEGCTARALEYACTYGHAEVAKFLINVRNLKSNVYILENATKYGEYEIVKLILPQFVDAEGIQTIDRILKTMNHYCYETKQLLRDHLNQLKGGHDQDNVQQSNNPLMNLIGWIMSPKRQ
ncbi:hypothetical protein DFA_04319 [Cavenderia fasciculata]|uniref:Ankyrin repeat-containing protein n=1 Tax=Cavenderia fasciculata TaxID=261658 RepID=F4PP88_CACFS|nr:uncharacterized protein DFA_04319 [Cavenderia fasciculata]EGG22201.1 hypothetical protein DFA_04319 [Cavenderia fasciculata]|eukprot:XP_004360052.1 hypothetical protein DFA_04319 [Cavenderia fasciculata]